MIQMVARCETVGKYILPVFRSLIARELINTYNLTQVEAAKKLGTTQAAISQYVNSKRAFKGAEKLSDIMPQLQSLACETANRIAKNEMRPEEITIDFCKVCPALCKKTEENFCDDFTI